MVETAMPGQVWVWITQATSGLAMWIGAVDHEAGAVDAVVEAVVELRLGEDVAVVVDLEQARRGDLLVEQAVGVDQEGIVLARHPHRDVVGDQVGHAVEVDQPVAGGEIDTSLPFLGRDVRPEVGNFRRS